MFILLLILGLLWPTQHLAPATMSVHYHSKPVHHVIVIPKPVETAPVTVQPVKQNIPAPVVTPPPAPVLVQPTIPKPPVISTPPNTNSCAPTATVQDPCKLGKCFGYPYGVCESNPNQGELTK